MQDQRSRGELDDARNDAAILGLLLMEPGLWAVDEVARVIGDELATTDALARLHRRGLLHRLSGYVFPTRTAVEFARVAE
jgi:hypothetical protein